MTEKMFIDRRYSQESDTHIVSLVYVKKGVHAFTDPVLISNPAKEFKGWFSVAKYSFEMRLQNLNYTGYGITMVR